MAESFAANTYGYEKLQDYFARDKKHFFYQDSKTKYDQFMVHANGEVPELLIKERRPSEPLSVFDYRCKIWEPVTKPSIEKVVSSLNKIRRSQEWGVNHPDDISQFSKISDDETLEAYCEEKYPKGFTSLTNWMFSVCLRPYLFDSNGVVLVKPITVDIKDTQYLEPFPIVFNCCDVVEYIEGELAILRDSAGCYYRSRSRNKETVEFGDAFYVVTTNSIERWEQVDNKKNFDMVEYFEHTLPILPCFKLGGIISRSQGYNYLYESRISGILPELNEAAREYSDLQASKVTNIYHERWEYTSSECSSCKGTGHRINPNWFPGCAETVLKEIDCDQCEGGYKVAGPYSKIVVRPGQMGANTPPLPPAGYIEKDVEIVRIMDTSFRDHIYYALSAINFQFLEQTPLNQSGKAKEVDKDELNNTVHGIAEDIVKNMDLIYKITAYMRYGYLYSYEQINEMLPTIAVPEHYDLLSTSVIQTELKDAKTGKANSIVVNSLEVEYATKRFNSDENVRDSVILMVKLDPMPSLSEDEKMTRLSNKGVTELTYIVSSNIFEFIQRAMFEEKDFADWGYDKQKEKIYKYAEEVQKANTPKTKIVDETMNGLLPGEGGQQKQQNGNGEMNDDGNFNNQQQQNQLQNNQPVLDNY